MMDDDKLKDMLLESLIEKMEDILGDGMKPGESHDTMMPEKGMSVEVAAPDKGALSDGLDKAKDVVDRGALPEMGGKSGVDDEEDDGKSDAERLAALLGDEDDEDEIGKK